MIKLSPKEKYSQKYTDGNFLWLCTLNVMFLINVAWNSVEKLRWQSVSIFDQTYNLKCGITLRKTINNIQIMYLIIKVNSCISFTIVCHAMLFQWNAIRFQCIALRFPYAMLWEILMKCLMMWYAIIFEQTHLRLPKSSKRFVIKHLKN